MRVLFDVTGPHGGRWVVDLRDVPHDELVYEWQGEPCEYRFEFESRNIEQVLRSEDGHLEMLRMLWDMLGD